MSSSDSRDNNPLGLRPGETVIVANNWICSSCGKANDGALTSCASCGNPKEIDERDTIGMRVVTDAAELAQARQVPNWICAFCKAQNRDHVQNCVQCGATRAASDARAHADPKFQQPPPSKEAVVDDPFVAAGAQEAVEPRSVQSEPASSWVQRTYFVAAHDRGRTAWRNRRIAWMALAVSIALVAAFLVWLFMPHKHEAIISDIAWQYTSTLQKRVPVDETDWKGGMPGDAYNVSCRTKFKGTRPCNPHDCRPHPVPYQCRPHDCMCHNVSHDMGNGYSSVTRQCSTCYDTCTRTEYDTCWDECDVYDDWCSYTHDTWPDVETQTTHGTDHRVYWPRLEATPPDERLQKKEEYTASFVIPPDDGRLYHPESLEEFARYAPGGQWVVQTRRSGAFKVFHRVGETSP